MVPARPDHCVPSLHDRYHRARDYKDLLAGNFIAALPIYVGLILFLVLFFGYKIAKKTKLVDLRKADFTSDYIREADRVKMDDVSAK